MPRKNEFHPVHGSLKIKKQIDIRSAKNMKTINVGQVSKWAGAATLGLLLLAASAEAASKKVLVVTTTTGFRHSSIATAERIIAQLGTESGAFSVDYARVDPNAPEFKGSDGKTDNGKVNEAIKKVLAEKMSPEALKGYDAVIFANTTGDLPLPDRDGFIAWVKSGKGFVGMHAAGDTFHGYRPYLDMLGAEFKTHGAQVKVDAINQDKDCPICKSLPGTWAVFDEIYQFWSPADGDNARGHKIFERATVHGLLTLDKHPNNGTPGDYPVSWCKEFGQGRVFYTSFGHREDVWDPAWKDRRNSPEIAKAYQQFILDGIKWVIRAD